MGSYSTDKKRWRSNSLIVYAGDEEEYITFISTEAWVALSDWMDYRRSSGELIDDNSWVMRDLWDTRVAQGRGLVTGPWCHGITYIIALYAGDRLDDYLSPYFWWSIPIGCSFSE